MVPALSRSPAVVNEPPSRISRLPPEAIWASGDRLLKLVPVPSSTIVAASVVMSAPSDIELLAPTIQVPPVSVPPERFVGADVITSDPPSVASTVPRKGAGAAELERARLDLDAAGAGLVEDGGR